MKKDGKICGKDNYGNNLYFPNYEDCPINKIYFSDKNEYLQGYKKINLNNGRYLYYTNESVEDKIIIDIRIAYNSKIPLNPEYQDDLTNGNLAFRKNFFRKIVFRKLFFVKIFS